MMSKIIPLFFTGCFVTEFSSSAGSSSLPDADNGKITMTGSSFYEKAIVSAVWICWRNTYV
jgi:hypothetical protein